MPQLPMLARALRRLADWLDQSTEPGGQALPPAEAAPASGPFVQPEADLPPPEAWLATTMPPPPEEWLALVRAHAPQLLDGLMAVPPEPPAREPLAREAPPPEVPAVSTGPVARATVSATPRPPLAASPPARPLPLRVLPPAGNVARTILPSAPASPLGGESGRASGRHAGPAARPASTDLGSPSGWDASPVAQDDPQPADFPEAPWPPRGRPAAHSAGPAPARSVPAAPTPGGVTSPPGPPTAAPSRGREATAPHALSVPPPRIPQDRGSVDARPNAPSPTPAQASLDVVGGSPAPPPAQRPVRDSGSAAGPGSDRRGGSVNHVREAASPPAEPEHRPTPMAPEPPTRYPLTATPERRRPGAAARPQAPGDRAAAPFARTAPASVPPVRPHPSPSQPPTYVDDPGTRWPELPDGGITPEVSQAAPARAARERRLDQEQREQ